LLSFNEIARLTAALKPLETLDHGLKRPGLPVKNGKRGSHTLLDGLALRYEPQKRMTDPLNGVQGRQRTTANPIALELTHLSNLAGPSVESTSARTPRWSACGGPTRRRAFLN
jgi:hypothetical protein